MLGATIVIDHGKALDGKNLIAIYGHVGEFKVNENDIVKRGDVIAKLPIKVKYRCMAKSSSFTPPIGQEYCEKDNWGCKYFIKDFYRSLDPHKYWPTDLIIFHVSKKINLLKKELLHILLNA